MLGRVQSQVSKVKKKNNVILSEVLHSGQAMNKCNYNFYTRFYHINRQNTLKIKLSFFGAFVLSVTLATSNHLLVAHLGFPKDAGIIYKFKNLTAKKRVSCYLRNKYLISSI